MTHWRQRSRRKSQRAVTEILQKRNARRARALATCVAEVLASRGPSGVTHDVVAERCGIPVQFVLWKYPSRRHLLALLDDAAVAFPLGA